MCLISEPWGDEMIVSATEDELNFDFFSFHIYEKEKCNVNSFLVSSSNMLFLLYLKSEAHANYCKTKGNHSNYCDRVCLMSLHFSSLF